MDIEQFPTIKKLALSIAHSNGCINRIEPASLALDRALEALCADGVATCDVWLLENWLWGLSEHQVEMLADGEQDEMDALMDSAPPSTSFPEHTVARLIEDMHAAITEN